jgi:bifunctional enzyme CysN/CysC
MGGDPLHPGLLRIATAGSVDDGKSTLVGRLLYDSKALHDDQLEALARVASERGQGAPDLALITDGLRAEREQGITIDVAYRYFSTPRRSFIIADTPGHLQYTRNMVTGASTADLAIVLVDARRGVVTQSRRHGFISALLRIPHMLVAVNKMDLAGYAERAFRAVEEEFSAFIARLGPALAPRSLAFVPLSALHGDNVVSRSARMPWYGGPSLVELLEGVAAQPVPDGDRLRLPVQLALRPHQDFRGFAGQIVAGRVALGDAVRVLPAGHASRIAGIHLGGEAVSAAGRGDAVVVELADAVDVGRGDMLVPPGGAAQVAARFECTLCWLGEEPLDPRTDYLLQHTTRQTTARVTALLHRVDVDTLAQEAAATLELNDVGAAQIKTAVPLCFDPYDADRATGSLILIDPRTHNTVAAGLIRRALPEARPAPAGRTLAGRTLAGYTVVWEAAPVGRAEREARNGHRAAVLWFTGLSGAGKSTIAAALERRLFGLGCQTVRLDGDNVRHGLNGDLGFGDADRAENIRRAAHVAQLAFEHGQIVLCTFISPFRADRALARGLLPEGRFLEIYVACRLDECARRDPKGLYARARRGEIGHFTGISSPYEEPLAPEFVAQSDAMGVDEIVTGIVDTLRRRGILGDSGDEAPPKESNR